jgi:5-methylcytosine-specific restriction endonuclease McrA
MPSFVSKQCPDCRRVYAADQLRKHRQDVHGYRIGSPAGWRKLRQQVIDRDGGRCVVCGSTERLEVHHVTGDSRDNDPSLLETRCSKHNPRGPDHMLSPYAGSARRGEDPPREAYTPYDELADLQ